MDAIISVAPIALMILLMTKKKGLPSHVALPFAALLVYAIKLIYFSAEPNETNATVVNGLLSAWVPILITSGAIFLFKTMEACGGMDTIRLWLNSVSENRVAQLMIVGWAFAFMIEGASGFGTPAALAAPILVGMGFDPFKVAVLCLIMNSVPVSFGAVGTPLWFGMGPLHLAPDEMLQIGRSSALIHAIAALVIPLFALLYVIERKLLRRNLLFVFLSAAACVVPYALLARVNYEFPALVGGMLGLLLTIGLAQAGFGLERKCGSRTHVKTSIAALTKAAFPLWGTVLVLLVTRIPQLGIKPLLTDGTPLFSFSLGSLAEVSVSRSLALTIENIFTATNSWTFETLYVPALIPFFLISFVTFALFRLGFSQLRQIFAETYQQMMRAAIALFGALAMVQLLMVGGDRSMVMIIGDFFAGIVGAKWAYFAAYLGALGTFFSGSATISNLTFGGIQNSIAMKLNLNRNVVLSMQSVGAAMGNMVCLNNIVAVCSILGIANREGPILKRTVGPMLFYGVIAAAVGHFL